MTSSIKLSLDMFYIGRDIYKNGRHEGNFYLQNGMVPKRRNPCPALPCPSLPCHPSSFYTNPSLSHHDPNSFRDKHDNPRQIYTPMVSKEASIIINRIHFQLTPRTFHQYSKNKETRGGLSFRLKRQRLLVPYKVRWKENGKTARARPKAKEQRESSHQPRRSPRVHPNLPPECSSAQRGASSQMSPDHRSQLPCDYPPRLLDLPGKSASGWTTRMCLVSASLRENVFSSVHKWQRTFCLRLLWIVSS